MAILVQLLGDPGSGKTCSMRDLNSKETFYINCDKKSMPFKGWRNTYNEENKNYLKTSDITTIVAYLKAISAKKPEIKTVIIDTINSIMSDREMAERKKKGFDRWMDYAGDIYDLYSLINDELREDLIVVIMAHTETYESDGVYKKRLKTVGSKLTKLNLEGKVTYTFYTEIQRNGDRLEYSLLTQSDGTNTARTPEGLFDYRIENNLNNILNSIRSYESE